MDAQPYVNPQFYLQKWHQATNEIVAGQAFEGLSMLPSDAEAFPAPTFAGDVGVSEAKCFVEAFLDEIDLRAVDQLEAFAIHDHLDATLIEDYVIVV